MAIVFSMPVALAIYALGNFSFVPGWFKFNFTVVDVYNFEDCVVGGCRFQNNEKHREW
jgi:hypothetical protein